MGSCLSCLLGSSREIEALPIETAFKMPSPMPSWPPGDGFAKGSIDLGGLEVRQISMFTKVWASDEGGGGGDDLGATFFAPSSVPDGFFVLGSYAQPNNRPLFGWVLVAKDTSNDGDHLAKPVDYLLVWSSESSNINKEGNGYFWLPVAPKGYKAAGHIVTSTSDKPSLDESRCVRNDFTEDCENDSQIWSTEQDGVNVYGLRPSVRGTQAFGVWVGTFAVTSNSSSSSPALACLKNKSSNYLSSMPNPSQIQAIVQAYSPWIYFHPDEPYMPSSVSWFFDNGGLLYQKGNATATRVDSTGSNLPQGGSNDGEYWLDLPVEGNERDRVMKGDLTDAESNIHVKPMLGGTFTDIAVWIFYPFNGPARAKVLFINVKLGKIGEHVGDWEHVTLRVSNLTGELWRVYFSEHSSGSWVDASLLEYQTGNKPVAYATLNGHAFYPEAGLVLQGDTRLGIGIRNDTARGKEMDTGAKFRIVSAEYLGPSNAVSEPPWLNYMREWGPKISYDTAKELAKVGRFLPKKLRSSLENMVKGLPDEVLGEEGPTGPKVKTSWNMDESMKS